MTSQFDKSGIYFAALGNDGKLKIWNTETNSLEQEYVPDLHLSSPCTCLQFLNQFRDKQNSASPKPKRKRRRQSFNDSNPEIVLGTTSGQLLIYSIAKGDINDLIDSNLKLPVSCLSSNIDESIFAGIENQAVLWNLSKKVVTSKWKTGGDKISAIQSVGDDKVLTASKTIKLWDATSKLLLKTFSGHSSDVHLLKVVPQVDPKYFISGSKGQRLLNCWNLNEEIEDDRPTAALMMEDVARNINVIDYPDGTTKLAASLSNGIIHLYQVILNGKCTKPVKPKSTIRVVSDSGQKKQSIIPIPIVSGLIKNDTEILIAHGSLILTFENVELTDQKLICLVRNTSSKVNDTKNDKILNPIIDDTVAYVTPFTKAGTTSKRKSEGKSEVPMEKRLENLTINNTNDGKVPRNNNMAHLLLQGLKSRDQSIIKSVLNKKDEKLIKNTIKRLPVRAVAELIKELTTYIQGKTDACQTGTLWMKHLIQTHSALLIANPELPDLFEPIMSSIEQRLTLQNPLHKLKGRLELLVSQISASANDEEDDEEAVLLFNDKDSDSDEEKEIADLLNSASENEWLEDEEELEQNSDVEMEENDDSESSEDEEVLS